MRGSLFLQFVLWFLLVRWSSFSIRLFCYISPKRINWSHLSLRVEFPFLVGSHLHRRLRVPHGRFPLHRRLRFPQRRFPLHRYIFHIIFKPRSPFPSHRRFPLHRRLRFFHRRFSLHRRLRFFHRRFPLHRRLRFFHRQFSLHSRFLGRCGEIQIIQVLPITILPYDSIDSLCSFNRSRKKSNMRPAASSFNQITAKEPSNPSTILPVIAHPIILGVVSGCGRNITVCRTVRKTTLICLWSLRSCHYIHISTTQQAICKQLESCRSRNPIIQPPTT